MGRQVAPVEAHPFHHIQLVVDAAALLHGDDAFAPHFVHRIGNKLGDGLLVGRKGGHPRHLLPAVHRHRLVADNPPDRGHRLIDAGLQRQRVGAGRNIKKTALNDGTGENHGGGSAVPNHIVGLGGGLLDHLRAHIFVGVGQLNLLGDGNAVAAHHRQGPHPAQDDIPPAGPQGKSHGAAQLVDAAHQTLAGGFVKNKLLFRHWGNPPGLARQARPIGTG